MSYRIAFALTSFLFVSACSFSGQASLAEAEVPKFHSMYDAGQFSAIYEASSKQLKATATQQKFVQLLDVIHQKLGATKSSEKINWQVGHTTSGVIVTLVYKTKFSTSTGVEPFVYRLEDGRPLLSGYHINDNDLLVK